MAVIYWISGFVWLGTFLVLRQIAEAEGLSISAAVILASVAALVAIVIPLGMRDLLAWGSQKTGDRDVSGELPLDRGRQFSAANEDRGITGIGLGERRGRLPPQFSGPE